MTAMGQTTDTVVWDIHKTPTENSRKGQGDKYMISRRMYNKLISLGFEVMEPYFEDGDDGRSKEEMMIVSKRLAGESEYPESHPKHFDHICTDFNLKASSDEALMQSLRDWYSREDERKETLIAWDNGNGDRIRDNGSDCVDYEDIPLFTYGELEDVFKALFGITPESLKKEDIPEPDDDDCLEFTYADITDVFRTDATKFAFTKTGKEKVSAFITELEEKRKEVMDAGNDTCDDTELPTADDILSDISGCEEFDEDKHDFWYVNGWGCTDHTDLSISLVRGEDYVVIE